MSLPTLKKGACYTETSPPLVRVMHAVRFQHQQRHNSATVVNYG